MAATGAAALLPLLWATIGQVVTTTTESGAPAVQAPGAPGDAEPARSIWAEPAAPPAAPPTPPTPERPVAAEPAPAAAATVVARPIVLVQTDAVLWAGDEVSPALGDAVAGTGFVLRRGRAGVDAQAGSMRARLSAEVASEGTTPGPDGDEADGPSTHDGELAMRLGEAFVGWAPSRGFHVEAGSLRVPFSRSRQTDEAALRLPERPMVVRAMAPDFRLGAALGGDLNLLQYGVGFFNTTETDAEGRVLSRGTLIAGRLAVEPIGPVGSAPALRRSDDPWWSRPRFAVGVSAFLERGTDEDNFGLGADAQFQWRRLLVTGEVLWVRRDPQRLGVVVEPGVFVIRDRLELVGRFEALDDAYDLASARDGWAAGGGLALDLGGHARLQAMALHRAERHRTRANDWALVRLGFALD